MADHIHEATEVGYEDQRRHILEGAQGKPVAELCVEHQIYQAQYYQWRDQFLGNTGQAFEGHQSSQRESGLQQENAHLK